MSKVLCTVGSVLRSRNHGVMIPLGFDIDATLWQALTTWAQESLPPAEYPSLARLLTTPLPTSLGHAELLRLQEEADRISPDSLAGAASDGFANLLQFIGQAVPCAEGLHKGYGDRADVRVVFQSIR